LIRNNPFQFYTVYYSMKTKKTDTIVRILNEFYEKKKEIDSFRLGSKSAIRHNPTWNKLERVWNDGHGIISFAVIAERDGKFLMNLSNLATLITIIMDWNRSEKKES